jgi:lysophospholipase L1-like esterase
VATNRLHSKLRRALAATVALSAGTIVALGLGELVVTWVAPQPVWIQPPHLYVPDPPARYRLNANVDGRMTDRTEYAIRILTNAEGVRVSPQDSPPAGRLPRVLALGDSFTFGVGVEEEETWIERLRAHLAESGIAIETINGGVPGYGAKDEVDLFERHLRKLKPDLVILAAYMANDMLDSSPASLTVEVRGEDGAIILGGHEPTVLDWLNYHSNLFLLVKNSMPRDLDHRLRKALGFRTRTFVFDTITTEMTAYKRTLPAGARAGLEATDQAYARLVELTRGSGIALVAMIFPEHITVDPAFWKARFQFIEQDDADYDSDAPRRRFAALFEKNGIPYVDMTDAVAAVEATGKHLYHPVDTHFTAAGHEVVARELANFLRANGLLPQGTPATSQAASHGTTADSHS